MSSVEWKDVKNKPDKLIIWLSMHSKINGGNLPIIINDFFTTDFQNFLFPQLNCLTEFFKFNSKLDNSLCQQLIYDSIKELIEKKQENSDNLLNLLEDKINKLVLVNETKHCLTSISAKKVSFRQIRIFESEIKFYKKFPSKFQSRKTILNRYKYNELKTFIKCVITTNTSSNELNDHLNNMDIFRALVNIYINSNWDMTFDGRSEPINKLRLGSHHTLHKIQGDLLNQDIHCEINSSSTELINIPKETKKRIERDLKIIHKCPYKDIIKKSLLLYIRSLDWNESNLSLTILWNSIELLLSKKNQNQRTKIKDFLNRCEVIFPNESYIGECLNAIRLIRNNFVHNYEGYEQSRKLTFQLQYIYKHILAYHLKSLSHCNDLNTAIDELDQIYSLTPRIT
ncbi:hypothetical protein [Legionella sp. WA2024007413]